MLKVVRQTGQTLYRIWFHVLVAVPILIFFPFFPFFVSINSEHEQEVLDPSWLSVLWRYHVCELQLLFCWQQQTEFEGECWEWFLLLLLLMMMLMMMMMMMMILLYLFLLFLG